jgi:hypothetical protein
LIKISRINDNANDNDNNNQRERWRKIKLAYHQIEHFLTFLISISLNEILQLSQKINFYCKNVFDNSSKEIINKIEFI